MDFEVIVIGGGPAGTQCACDLAMRGISVCVLEQGPAQDSRRIPCLVGPKIENKFGEYPSDLIDGACTQFRFIASKDFVDLSPSAINGPHLGRFANKNALTSYDRQKAIAAGATYHFNTKVISVEITDTRAEVMTDNPSFPRVTAEVVGLSPGIHSLDSILQRSLQLPIPQTTQLVWKSYRLPSDSETRRSNTMGVIWNQKVSLHAYAVYYNTEAGLFVALLDHGRSPEDMTAVLDEVCTRHKMVIPILAGAEPLQLPGVEPVMRFPREIMHPTFRDRLLVMGDAAGFATIFLYEGYYQAKVSGRCAAETIRHAKERGRFDSPTLALYKQRWEAELDEVNLRPGRASAYIFYESGKLDTVSNALVKALKREQEAGKTKIQKLWLQNIIEPKYSRNDDLEWTKALLSEMSIADKALMLPRFLKAGFMN